MEGFELLVDFFKEIPRQGPGSTTETLRAWQMTGLSSQESLKIADIGCGTGSQTLVLAQATPGQITAVDLFPEFLEKLQNQAQSAGFADQISTLAASMESLPFGKEEYDLIWSEGAIYSMGFEKGIKNWHSFLGKGGFLVVSEITWTTHSRPKEIEDFWSAEYPEISTAATKIRQLEESGYSLSGYFELSPESWLENYYSPMEKTFPSFLERQGHSEMAQQLVDENKAEIERYKKFKDFFSYGFYIARKN